MSGWVSPRLGIRFEVGNDLTIFGPDGRPFATYLELAQQRDESDRRADEAARRADEAERRADRLAAKLRELGLDPNESI
jgi:hypothetical protein